MEVTVTSTGTEIITSDTGLEVTINLPSNQIFIDGTIGAKGEKGDDAAMFHAAADQALGGHRVVKATSTGIDYASADNAGDIGLVVGMTKAAWNQGDNAEIHNGGEIIEPSWAWNLGAVYLGANGLMTQNINGLAFVQQIATAVSQTRILIDIKQPIRR